MLPAAAIKPVALQMLCMPSNGVAVLVLQYSVQGRPIYIQLLGKIDIGTLKQITTEERMIKFHIQEYERCGKVIMPICSKLQGRQIDQTFGIMDVKGEQEGAGVGGSCVSCLDDAW